MGIKSCQSQMKVLMVLRFAQWAGDEENQKHLLRWKTKETYLYSKYPKCHDSIILFLFGFFCRKLQPTDEIYFTALLNFSIFAKKKQKNKKLKQTMFMVSKQTS